MKRFKKILFVHSRQEGEEKAFARAVELATRNDATLTVVSATGGSPSGLGLPETGLSPEQVTSMIVEEWTAETEQIARSLAQGLKVDTKVLVGTGFIEIIREVIRGGYDLVIKPAENIGGIRKLLFGSVDMHLFRKCPCPVWIVKSVEKKKYRSILAAVDPDPEVEGSRELNRKIIELATSLARIEGSRLHVVHAWHMLSEHILVVRGGYTRDEVRMLAETTRDTHNKRFRELLDGYDIEGLKIEKHLLSGQPGEVIPEFASLYKVELVVMGTVVRTGLPGFIIGNTAEKMLSSLDCSVLAVKPDGFVTPVEA